MAKCCVLVSIALVLASTLFAQSTNIGTVTAIVVDETTNRPLEFVNAGLHKKLDSSLVKGMVTDKNGKFELGNIPDGDYYMRLTLMGYKANTTQSFIIDPQHKHPNLGTIALVEAEVMLEDVLVTGQKELFNNSIDRKVYNVDQDIMSKSGSASELLQNVPSVQVDIDGNVSLRGASDVLILINGKNSSLMGRNRAEVLQQLDAGMIERIEVITNPSAKFKPDGTSGIINIVLKKNTSTGLNGSVTANVGNQHRYNGSIRLNYSPGGFNLFGSYSFRQDSRNRINSDSRQQIDTASTLTYFRQDLNSNADPISHLIALGFDAEIGDANSFGATGNYFYNGFTRTDHARNVFQNSDGVLTQGFDRNRLDNEFQKDYGFTAFLQHKFPEEDHKLRLEFNFSGHPEKEDNHFTNIHWFPSGPTQYDHTLIQPLENRSQLSLDYTDVFEDHSKLEAGYAGEINHSNYDFLVENFDSVQNKFVADIGKTNLFIFDETINALYLTYEHSFGAFGLLGGMRAEQSNTKSNLVTRDSIITNSYFNVYPTVHLAYKLSDATEFQLNYSRRVHRPQTEDLNPFPEYRDPRNLSSGNPGLLPEYIHSIEFGYSFRNDLFSIIPSIYYRNISNKFTRVVQALNDSTLLTTHTNLARDQTAGAELIASANLGDVFSSHASVNVFSEQIDASNLGYGTSKSVVTWSGALTFSVHITKRTMLQMNMNYNAYRLTPQGEYLPSYVVNMGAREDLIENTLSLTLTITDLFHTLKRHLELNTPLLKQTVIDMRDSGIIYVGLTYNFGTSTKKPKKDTLHYDDDN